MFRYPKRNFNLSDLNLIIKRKFSETVLTAGYNINVAKGDLLETKVNVLPKPKYGGISTVSILTGESTIGKQGARYITGLGESAGVPIYMQRIGINDEVEYFNSVLRNRACVHVDISHDAAVKEKTLKLCNDLDLNVFTTRLRTFPGFNCRFPDVDIKLIAQNNMGNYAELEYSPVPGIVEALRVTTKPNAYRFFKYAFDIMNKNGDKRLVVVHQSDEWPLTDGAFVKVASELQKSKYSNIELEFMSLHECINRLIVAPNYFNVLATNDCYGTFIATIGSAVCGGANLFSSCESGKKHAIFKPLQTKLSLTNYKELSPYGIVSTCVDLLRHLGHEDCANKVWDEMIRSMCEGVKTKCFGGTDSGEYVICNISNQLKCDRSSSCGSSDDNK